MTTVKAGDIVKIRYTGSFDNGKVFDSSSDKGPLQFVVGEGQVLRGLDTGVAGMKVGETKKIHIPAAEAYGAAEKKMSFTVDREKIPEKIELKVGKTLKVSQPSGAVVLVSISDFSDEEITFTANHPLAGKNLNFEIELIEIV